MSFPIFYVGYELPLRATYSRHVLSPVVGSPNLRVLCVIRLPSNHRQLALLQASSLSRLYGITVDNQRSPVSVNLRVSGNSVISSSFQTGP